MTADRTTNFHAVGDVFVFFAITIWLSYFVFWGPIALFQIPTISFVDDAMGPIWAIMVFMLGGFVPSLTAIAWIWNREMNTGATQLASFESQI